MALALTVLFIEAPRVAARVPGIVDVFAILGQASLVIMFVHQFVHFSLREIGWRSEEELVAVFVAVSVGLFYLTERSPLIAGLYFGKPLGSWTQPVSTTG